MSWQLFRIVARDEEVEVCPQLCPEPVRSAQAALLGTPAGTGGLCLKQTPVGDVLGNLLT